MALWKDSAAPAKEAPPIITPPAEPVFKREPEHSTDIAPQAPRRVAPRDAKESVIAADITITGKIVGAGHVRIAGRFEGDIHIEGNLTITGKIVGAGHVRIAGRFEGDIHIEGNLTIEQGAKITGGIRADSVAIAGEVDGNIDNAAKVELLSTGVLNGDLKAGTLTVAAGSRMRGRVEFGWGDDHPVTSPLTLGPRQVS